MGLSIHYSAKIKEYTLINEMIAEVVDICESLNWKYQLFHPKEFNLNSTTTTPVRYTPHDVKGISFTPEESESVFLTFLPEGILCSPLKLICYDPATNDLMIEVVHTKTQFAGPDTHIAILKLLSYLKDKYFETFELIDEGDYWNKWDKKILHSQFIKYDFILDTMTAALSYIKREPGETAESLANKIEEMIKKNLVGNNRKMECRTDEPRSIGGSSVRHSTKT